MQQGETYTTVFDIRSNLWAWALPLIVSFTLIAVGILQYHYKDFIMNLTSYDYRHRTWPQQIQDGSFRFTLIMCLLIAAVILCSWVPYIYSLIKALRVNNCECVEGIIENFECLTQRNTCWESFSVNGQYFCYSDSVLSGGYHQTSNRGGLMREGLKVKIYFQRDVILRLDIANLESRSINCSQ